MSLEDLEKELYGFKKAGRRGPARTAIPPVPGRASRRPVKTEKTEPLPERWPEPAMPKKRSFGPLAYVSIISIVVIAVGVFLIFQYLNSSEPQIKMEMAVPASVPQGVPFEATVNISNQADTVLRESALTIVLPEGIRRLSDPAATEIRESLGDIGIGGISKRTFTLIATENNGEGAKNFIVSFLYSIGSGERFEQGLRKGAVVQEPAINLTAATPERVLSGSAFDIIISYQNDSNFDFENLRLEISYPPDFSFISSDLTPTSLNNLWELGELRADSKGSIKVRGSVTAPPQSFFSMPVTLRGVFSGQEFTINKTDISISVSPSPLDIAIVVNGNPNYIARIGDRLSYIIGYQNNSGVALADVVLRAKIVGELFDLATIQTRANIDTLNRTLLWNASNVPEFRLLPPGASGSVTFDARLVSDFPIRRLNDKDYILRIEASMDSPTVPYYLEAEKTSGAAAKETKVSGLIAVDAQAFYRDAASGILNLGSMPPKVNQPTQYTVHWQITNYATDVRDVTVRAFLQSGVSWTGFVKSNVDTVPLYNERTQEVVWDIDRIVAAKGFVNEPVEAIFQIQAVPDATQVGQYQPLLSETRISATDEFTGLQLENFDTALTTSLPDDLTVGQGTGRVVQ